MYQPLKDTRKHLLLDTDIGPDCDDVGAIAVMAALCRRYDIPVDLIVNCTSNHAGTLCAEVIARYCGLAVGGFGENKQPGFLDGDAESRYNRFVAAAFGSDHAVPDAVTAYRRALSLLPDKGGVLCAIGPLSTLVQLMQSKPDGISPLDGRALLAQKIDAVVAMAGKFPEGREFNVFSDTEASQTFFGNCPVPIYLSDFDVGATVRSGFDADAPLDGDNPVMVSYRRYLEGTGREYRNASFDLTAVHFAIEGVGDAFGLAEAEDFTVLPDGSNTFVPRPDGRFFRIVKRLSDEALGRFYDRILGSTR